MKFLMVITTILMIHSIGVAPPYVQTTCFKLWEKYPDYAEAEQFIRAQFALQVEELDYSIPKVVSHFTPILLLDLSQ